MCLKALLGDLLPQSAPPLPSKHAPVDGCAHKPTLIVWCVALAGSNIRISIWKLAAGRCCCHCCCCVLCSPSGWQLLCSLQPSAHRALLHSWLLLCISCTSQSRSFAFLIDIYLICDIGCSESNNFLKTHRKPLKVEFPWVLILKCLCSKKKKMQKKASFLPFCASSSSE